MCPASALAGRSCDRPSCPSKRASSGPVPALLADLSLSRSRSRSRSQSRSRSRSRLSSPCSCIFSAHANNDTVHLQLGQTGRGAQWGTEEEGQSSRAPAAPVPWCPRLLLAGPPFFALYTYHHTIAHTHARTTHKSKHKNITQAPHPSGRDPHCHGGGQRCLQGEDGLRGGGLTSTGTRSHRL